MPNLVTGNNENLSNTPFCHSKNDLHFMHLLSITSFSQSIMILFSCIHLVCIFSLWLNPAFKFRLAHHLQSISNKNNSIGSHIWWKWKRNDDVYWHISNKLTEFWNQTCKKKLQTSPIYLMPQLFCMNWW